MRLFFAAPMPLDAAQELFENMAELRRRHPDVRWAKVEQLHATLLFLGQTDASEVDRLIAATDSAADGRALIAADTAESGGRAHDRRDGVAWLRIDRGSRELASLSVELDRLVGSDQYKTGEPRPHITVARRVDRDFLHDLRAAAPDLRTEWTFNRVGLYRSHAEPGGSRYVSLHEAVLTGSEAAA